MSRHHVEHLSRLIKDLANQTMNLDNPRVGYLWLCNIMSIDSFTGRALRVLFSSEFSEADYMIVSIGLYWLFFILSIASPDQDLGSHVRREDLIKEGRLCRENLETSLSTIPFHFPGDEDHIEALIMAVSGCVLAYLQYSEPFTKKRHASTVLLCY